MALTDDAGAPIIGAACHLSWSQLSSATAPGLSELTPAVSADLGNTFRYDAEEGQYVYNLSTKGLSPGTWELGVTVEGYPGFEATVLIGLR